MKESVSIQILGGIGNNIMQIACAYAYSLKYNKELILVNEKFGTTHNPLDTYKNNILRNIKFVDKYDFNGFKIYNEPFFNYTEIPSIEGDVLLQGYFQSELYFKEYEKEIRDLFSFPEELIFSIKEKYKDILNKETCSVHVRRGDYLQLQHVHYVQNINYYMKAIKNIGIDKTYVFFSDDISWCKQNFDALPSCYFIENQEDYLDLLLMSLMNDNIIANSSFSWWGAYLNKNSEKKIIAPLKWFGENVPNDTKDLCCENWIKI